MIKKIIGGYRGGSIYKKLVHSDKPPKYLIEAPKGIFYYSSAVDHELQKDILDDDQALAIAKELIDKHLQSQEDAKAEFFRLNVAYEEEPTFFEIEQAAGEIPTDDELYDYD